MDKHYDVVVIGAGSAATSAAQTLRAAGRRVAVVDFRPFGGTCALRGCDPKKVLRAGAAAVDYARRLGDYGVAGSVQLDWRALMAFKHRFTDPVPDKTVQWLHEQGIDTFHARATFTGRNTLQVGNDTLNARHILLASGAEPTRLGIAGEQHLANNEDFLNLDALPQRIVLVGGGFIAAEFSQIAARAGAQVTVLQRGARILTGFEPELVEWLMASFRTWGIEVLTDTSVEAIERRAHGFRVQARRHGASLHWDADLVVHAAGRRPDFESLNLPAAEVAVEHGRLRLNEYLQSTTNPAVYAAGDAAQTGPLLTPVSQHDAAVVAANLLRGNHRRPDYTAVAKVAFTVPPIAAVGLSEAEARQQGLRVRVACQRTADWFSARHVAEPVAGFKLLIDADSERILGAHLVGPHADEVINVFALAIRYRHTVQELQDTLFAYPTAAADIGAMVQAQSH